MGFEHYVRSGQRLLRCGYTTGTCAALAAQGAVQLLLTGTAQESVSLVTRKGPEVCIPVDGSGIKDGEAWCSVTKDAGDDADVTNGITIVASAKRSSEGGIEIDGGEGIGRVTKPGLDQPVGAAAINRVPREMIAEQVEAVCDELDYSGGISIVISAPKGEEIARQTFNPLIGVTGGISVLGTSGIVEPMSEKAIVDTIALEIHQASLSSRELILTPGNYGQTFLRERGMTDIPIVKCSNFIGDALDLAATEGFERVLVVGHIGKLVKLAGGIMNTHSCWADCRTELFCAYAAVNGASTELCRRLMSAATTDACIEVLDSADLREAVLSDIMDAALRHLEHRAAGKFKVGVMMFSNEYGSLGERGMSSSAY